MNRIFDIHRLGKYFLYDLNRARGNYMWSAIVMATLPAIFFAAIQFFSLLFSGHFVEDAGVASAPVAAFAIVFATVLTFPVKMYGNITEKRFGSDYLMIPASTFEKWLTMILMTCVVMPLCLMLSFLALDGVLALCLGKYYGPGIIAGVSNFGNFAFGDSTITFRLSAMGYMEWLCSILVFTLGAICFKTGKVGKTIMTLLLVGFATGTLATIFVTFNIQGITDWAQTYANTPEESIETFVGRGVWFVRAWYLLEFSALAGAIYYRIRTLTH